MTFWPLVTALLPELRAYARSVADNAAEADDLVSDAVERAARAEAAPDTLTSLKPWMFRVIRNLNLDELRKRRVRKEYSADIRRLYSAEPAPRHYAEEGAAVRRAYHELGAKEREVLCLVDILGMTYREAASVMNVPVGTVMSRVSRARRALLLLIDPARGAAASSTKTTGGE